MAVSYELQKAQSELKKRRQSIGVDVALSTEIIQQDNTSWISDLAQPTAPQKPQKETAAPQIRLFGRMMTRSQLLRHELSFRLWAAIRWLAAGENHVSTMQIRQEFSDNGQYAFTSWPNLRKQINRAIDRGYLHYSKDKEQIYFTSESRVALEVLGLAGVGGWALNVSIEELKGDFMNNRSLFYASFHGSRGDGFSQPISRQSIQGETGRGKRTQRKYEKRAGVKTSRNFEYVGRGTNKLPLPDTGLLLIGSGKDRMLVKQLPNSFSANLQTVKRGRRWLNQRITNLCKKSSDNGQYPPVIVMGSCGTEIKQKRYFTKPPNVSADNVRFYPLPGTSWLWKRIT